MGDLKPTSQFAVRHLSSCDWPSFEPRLGMFRGEVRHVSGCERPCFALPSGMFCGSVRHVLSCGALKMEELLNAVFYKSLIVRRL